MSAPMIIPFNNMPVNTVASRSGSYTVPAGKYARVSTANVILPTLNSVDLYNTVFLGNLNIPTAVTETLTGCFSASNVHRVILGAHAGGSSGTVNWAPTNILGAATGGLVAPTLVLNVPANSSVEQSVLLFNANVYGITVNRSTSINIINVRVDCNNGPEFLWLKAGDVLTFVGGSIVYEEYNVIS